MPGTKDLRPEPDDANGGFGILVANLGTPDAPTPAAVRRFLAEFLWDRRVVDLPRLPWWLLLHGVVLPLRPRRSARAYREIWTDAGSPLMTGTRALVAALDRRLQALLAPGPPIAMGMTYGNPSIAAAVETLQAAGIRRLVVLPLFPQYSATTTAAVLDRVRVAIAHWQTPPELLTIEDYHAEPDHIAALAASIVARGIATSADEHLLFSFHGIPRRYADAGDPYGDRCQATARLVAAKLALPPAQWSVAFQSRVGGARWLEPYTEERLATLAQIGMRGLAVVCPGFAVDCLETLEEIAIRGRATFLAAGGERFDYVPALNDDAAQVECFARLITARVSRAAGGAA
jgi:protoporphyrin/coproporphyrin ferrochelatase